MKKTQEKALFRTIAIAAIFFFAVAGYYLYRQRSEVSVFRDENNRVSFERPEKWYADSTPGYNLVAEGFDDMSKPSVLIKSEYPESIIPALGLDVGTPVTIGGKSVLRVDHEWELPARPELPAGTTQTFTFLMWTAPDGRKIIFEITPWQKPDMHPEVERIVRTFNAL